MTKENTRKLELLAAVKTGVRDMLASTRGANMFGAHTEMYEAKRPTNVLVINTSDGEFYLIKVQKSLWEAKS